MFLFWEDISKVNSQVHNNSFIKGISVSQYVLHTKAAISRHFNVQESTIVSFKGAMLNFWLKLYQVGLILRNLSHKALLLSGKKTLELPS